MRLQTALMKKLNITPIDIEGAESIMIYAPNTNKNGQILKKEIYDLLKELDLRIEVDLDEQVARDDNLYDVEVK